MACHCRRSANHWLRMSAYTGLPTSASISGTSDGSRSAACFACTRRSWRFCAARHASRNRCSSADAQASGIGGHAFPGGASLGHAIDDVFTLEGFHLRAHGGALGLLALDGDALALGLGARGLIGREALANDVRRRFEMRADVGLHVGVGEVLDPRHARGGIRFAQRGEVVHACEAGHLRHQFVGALLIRVLVDRPFGDRRRGLLERLEQRTRLLLRRLGARLLADRRERVHRGARQPVHGRHGRVGMIAAQGDAFNFLRVGQALHRQQPRARIRGMTRDAPEGLLVAHPGDRGAPHGIGPRGPRHGGELALAAQRGQRRHGGQGPRLVVLRGLLHQLRHGVVAHGRVRLVAGDVGQHGRVADARDRGAAHARIGVVLGERDDEIGVDRGVEFVHAFDANGGIGVLVLGLRTEFVENAHGGSDPGDPVRVGRRLPSTFYLSRPSILAWNTAYGWAPTMRNPSKPCAVVLPMKNVGVPETSTLDASAMSF